MAGLARRIAPAAALGGLAVVIVGVADPALAGHGDAPSSSAISTTATSAPATAQPATCDTAETATGPAIDTRWGPVQVAATIANGKLCAVHAVVWPDGDNRSVQISEYAIPELDSLATQQGVQFDGVSGATYTSDGYRQSLQQLLDSL